MRRRRRSHEHGAARIALAEQRIEGGDQRGIGGEVDGQHFFPVPGCHRHQWSTLSQYAGIANQHVEAPEACGNHRSQRGDAVAVAHVERYSLHAADGFDVTHGADHVAASRRQGFSHGPAEATGRTCYQCDPQAMPLSQLFSIRADTE